MTASAAAPAGPASSIGRARPGRGCGESRRGRIRPAERRRRSRRRPRRAPARRDEFTASEVRRNLLPELGAVPDVAAEDVAARHVHHAVARREDRTLGSLAEPGAPRRTSRTANHPTLGRSGRVRRLGGSLSAARSTVGFSHGRDRVAAHARRRRRDRVRSSGTAPSSPSNSGTSHPPSSTRCTTPACSACSCRSRWGDGLTLPESVEVFDALPYSMPPPVGRCRSSRTVRCSRFLAAGCTRPSAVIRRARRGRSIPTTVRRAGRGRIRLREGRRTLGFGAREVGHGRRDRQRTVSRCSATTASRSEPASSRLNRTCLDTWHVTGIRHRDMTVHRCRSRRGLDVFTLPSPATER